MVSVMCDIALGTWECNEECLRKSEAVWEKLCPGVDNYNDDN